MESSSQKRNRERLRLRKARRGKRRRARLARRWLRVMPDLLGGLGNQLFVVAACYWYAKSHGGGVVLDRSQRQIRSYGTARPSYAATVFRAFAAVPKDGFHDVPQAKVHEPPLSASVRLTEGYYQDRSSMRRLLQVRDAFVKELNIPGLQAQSEAKTNLLSMSASPTRALLRAVHLPKQSLTKHVASWPRRSRLERASPCSLTIQRRRGRCSPVLLCQSAGQSFKIWRSSRATRGSSA